MSAVNLVPQQTAAFPVVFRNIRENQTLFAIGLGAADAIPVKIVANNGKDGSPVLSEAASQEGTPVALTAINNTIHLEAPMSISVEKGVTVGIAGVFITNRTNL